MNEQLKELLYQMLETEMGGEQVYTTAFAVRHIAGRQPA